MFLLPAGCQETPAETRDPVVPDPVALSAPLAEEFARICLATDGKIGRVRAELGKGDRYSDVEHADFVDQDGGLLGARESAVTTDGSGISVDVLATEEEQLCSVSDRQATIWLNGDGTVGRRNLKGRDT
ncbi:hypothetical protein [Jannaschia pagri]|uniref:hypothetical protein n=1 Tax=Jannaschia pagri TaxID=2829797 RepID=UPI001C7D0FB9|nr:hypothetical protein [Jannaschia sp. AI_62]